MAFEEGRYWYPSLERAQEIFTEYNLKIDKANKDGLDYWPNTELLQELEVLPTLITDTTLLDDEVQQHKTLDTYKEVENIIKRRDVYVGLLIIINKTLFVISKRLHHESDDANKNFADSKINLENYVNQTNYLKNMLAAAKGYPYDVENSHSLVEEDLPKWNRELVLWNNKEVDVNRLRTRREFPELYPKGLEDPDNPNGVVPQYPDRVYYPPNGKNRTGGSRRTRKHNNRSNHKKHNKSVAYSRRRKHTSSLIHKRHKRSVYKHNYGGSVSKKKYKPTHTRNRKYNKSRTYKYNNN